MPRVDSPWLRESTATTGRPVATTASMTGPKMPCSSPLPWSMSTGGMAGSMPKGVPGTSRAPWGA